ALQANTTVSLPNNVLFNGMATIQGTGNVSFTGTTATALGANVALTVNNPVTTVANALTGVVGNNLVLAGTGQLVLTAANTYAGDTIVNGGTLKLRDNGAINPAALANLT